MYSSRDKTNLIQARLIFFRILASCPWARIYYPVPQTVFYLGRASFQMAERLLRGLAFEEFNYSSHSARRKLCCRGRCSSCITFDIPLLEHGTCLDWKPSRNCSSQIIPRYNHPCARFGPLYLGSPCLDFRLPLPKGPPFHLAAFAPASPPVFSEQLSPTNVSRTLQ